MTGHLLTAAQMRAIEKQAMGSGQASGRALMERAGAGVVSALQEKWPDAAHRFRKAVVLCGPGNNGGDGYVIARLLHEQGVEVSVLALAEPGDAAPDAQANATAWGKIGEVSGLDGNWTPPNGPCLIIDALFGTGLTRPIQLPLTDWSQHAQQVGAPVIAVDLPSGLCSDSGRVIGDQALRSDLTVTFHQPKLGHVLGQGPEVCGELVCADIGLLPEQDAPSFCTQIGAPEPSQVLKRSGHKFAHGHALVLSGGAGKSGAARLSAMSALRIGAGLVTIGADNSSFAEVAHQITALMVAKIDSVSDLNRLLGDARYNALCLGPGLGLDKSRAMVPNALAWARSTVLDADALSAFADNPQHLFDALHPQTVLTPHGGEFARLFPDLSAKMAATAETGPAFSKVDAVRLAAARAGCVLLLKGPDTVIAAPDGRAAINAAVYDQSAPWLATAGSGDVLSGMICGLMARGHGPFDAARIGAWMHAECARRFGPGLIADDLPHMIPKVLKELGPA